MSIDRMAGMGVLVLLLPLTASCNGKATADRPPEPLADASLPVGETGAACAEERALWIAMADEPLHHMGLARTLAREGKPEEAARQLDLSAAFFRWGRLYADAIRERRDLVDTAQEIETAARRMRAGELDGDESLDHVLTTAFRVMAEHHAALALEQWKAGEHTQVALLLRTSADELERGLSLSGANAGGTIERALAEARAAADRLDSKTPPSAGEVVGAVEGLRDVASDLDEALTGRWS